MTSRPDYEPSSGDNSQWVLGIAVPLLAVGYGMFCFVTQHVRLTSHHTLVADLHGVKAVAVGVASTSIGLFFHFHLFWGESLRLSRWADLGRIVSMTAFIVSLGYVMVRVAITG
jgi:hypothetical protein